MAVAPHPSLISNACHRRRRDERLLASKVDGRQGTVPGADQEQRQPARRGRGLWFYDRTQGIATRRSLFNKLCDTSTLLCPAHFPSPSRGRLTRWGEGFRYNPV
jgi:hypothetical protein